MPMERVSYTYDAVGNRTSQTTAAGTINYTYDSANQLLTAGARRFTYDANGNLIGVWEGSSGRVYTWDYQGQLRAVTARNATDLPYPLSLAASGGSELAGHSYDLLGRELGERDASGRQTNYLIDGHHALASVSGGQTVSRSVYGYRWDDLRAWDRGEGTQALYPLADAMGTVTGAVDHKGELHHAARYDPWGAPLQRDADSPLPGFQGRPYDVDTGLYDFRARYYDPELGRFISPDPVAYPYAPRSLNGYVFGQNNPLRHRDPTGRILPIVAAIAIGAAIGAGYYGGRYFIANWGKNCFSWGELAIHAGKGAVIGGAVAGVGYLATAYLIGALGVTSLAAQVGIGAVVGAGTGALESVADQMWIQGKTFGQLDKTDILISTAAGAIGGGVSVGIAKPFQQVGTAVGLAQPGQAVSEAAGPAWRAVASELIDQGLSKTAEEIFGVWWKSILNAPSYWR
ncbi:MAG: RHS repeat-associated core domain-containing protein [Anaerolineae bacterium]